MRRLGIVIILLICFASVNFIYGAVEASTIRLLQDKVCMNTTAKAGGVIHATNYTGPSFGVNPRWTEVFPSLEEIMGPWSSEYEEWTNYLDYTHGGAAALIHVGWNGSRHDIIVQADTYTGADTLNDIYDRLGIEYESSSKINTSWSFRVQGDGVTISFDRVERVVPLEVHLYDATAGVMVAEFFITSMVDGTFDLFDSHKYLLTSVVHGYNTDPPQGFFANFNGATIITPEPATMLLLGLGLVGLAGVRRKFKK